MIGEIKPIDGYPGYGASEDGRIWSRWGMAGTGLQEAWKRSLRPGSNMAGYQIVALHKDGKQTTKTVHKLVWQAFNGLMPDKMEVNHINGDKRDNSLANLEMVTSSENKQHAIRTGLRTFKSKLTREDVDQIRVRVANGEFQRVVGESFGITQTTVSNIIHGKIWANDLIHIGAA